MFPNYLDGAKVLEFTSKGHFGFLTEYEEDHVPIEKEICYYAICRYDNGGYYVFSCDSQYNVLIDAYLDTLDKCRNYRNLPDDTIWYNK